VPHQLAANVHIAIGADIDTGCELVLVDQEGQSTIAGRAFSGQASDETRAFRADEAGVGHTNQTIQHTQLISEAHEDVRAD